MQANFSDAHERHWRDAEILFDHQRLANADHLYGMAAECGLKSLMLVFDMPFDSQKNSPTDRRDVVHADKIWERYESYRHGHHRGTAYGLPSSNPFTDWHAAQRYASQHHFDADRVNAHRTGAEQVNKLLRIAARDGLI